MEWRSPLQRVVISPILNNMATRSVLVIGVCLAMLCFFAPRSSSGEPFLISDPYPNDKNQPTRFVIVEGEYKYNTPAQKLPDGGVRLRFDLSLLPDGEHTVYVRAIDDRKHRESNSTPLRLVKIGEKVTLLKPLIPESKIPKGLLRQPGQ